jgi:hypothetical protein
MDIELEGATAVSLTELPADVVNHVITRLDGPSSVAALAAACNELSIAAGQRLHAEREAWDRLIERAGKPFASLEAGSARLMDDTVARFVFGSERTTCIQRLTAQQRKWLHMRAASTGLQSTTERREGRRGGGLASLRLTKPPGWVLPRDPVSVRPKLSSRAELMARWCTDCDSCGAKLDAYNAMYHHSGMGPLCEDCIQADPDLEGLKWEAKADFWY